MPHVLTLIAATAGDLSHSLVARCREALATEAPPHWLADATACDLPFSAGMPCERALGRIRDVLADTPIDAAAQPAPHRRKRLLLADMDSTIIQQECVDELAAAVGIGARVAAVTERAMRGEIAFEPALRERVGLLRGLPLAELGRVYRERIRLTPGAATLCATMRAHGARTALVSGGFTFFTERVARDAGFDQHESNVLRVADGALSGEVQEPIVGKEAKLAALHRHCAELGIEPRDAICVGDGANDLAMLTAAGLGVAFHAKPVVAAATSARIDHGDLTALLYLQGYARADWSDGPRPSD